MDGLAFAADEKTAGGTLYGTVYGVVRELFEIEIGSEFTVDASQQVQIEPAVTPLGSSYARTITCGSF